MTKKSKGKGSVNQSPEELEKRKLQQSKKKKVVLIDNIMSLFSSSILCFIIPIIIIHLIIVAVIKIGLGEISIMPEIKTILNNIVYKHALCVKQINIGGTLQSEIKKEYNTMVEKIVSNINNGLSMLLMSIPFVSFTLEKENLEAIVKNIGYIGDKIPESDTAVIQKTFGNPNNNCSTEVTSLPDLLNIIDINDLLTSIPGLNGVNLNNIQTLADAHKGIIKNASNDMKNFSFSDAISSDNYENNPLLNSQELIDKQKKISENLNNR